MHHHNTSHAIVGHTLCAMVAALELAKQGEKVLLVNSCGASSDGCGGHFSGFNSGGQFFDLGLVTSELRTFSAQTSSAGLPEYNAALGNDARRYLDVVNAWLTSLVELKNISTPQMFVGGELFDDVLSANNDQIAQGLQYATLQTQISQH